MNDNSDLEDLLNLGPKSIKWLNGIGIFTYADLRDRGAVEAYCLLKSQGENVSLNLLYAMYGALNGVAWNEISPEVKDKLKQSVAAFRFL